VDKDGNVHESANRRVFYDFTLSPPKSVSIAALVGNDKRIIEAHDEAVTVAMREFANLRCHSGSQTESVSHRVTGNVVGAVFRHDTSRDLDPHLHSHCILFNATWDSLKAVGKHWKPVKWSRRRSSSECLLSRTGQVAPKIWLWRGKQSARRF
jgi:conjugative relaxase-like TrwC/TraI family protein